jgi:hypothetical protein
VPNNPNYAPPPAAYPPSPYGTPPGPQAAMQGPPSGPMPSQLPVGTPGAMPVDGQMAGLAQPGQQPSKTMLGVASPVGLGNYATGGYRPPPQQMSPMGYPQQQSGGYPQQQSGGYPQHSGGYQQPYGQQPYPGSGPLTAPPVEPLAPVVEGKKSTLVRDIGIGVAIAALVLVGFLGVKMFVLDKKDDAGSAQPASSIATIKISLTAGVTAELWVDDKKIASVSDGQSVPLTPGLRRVKLLGPNNARCEEPVKLEPGQTTTLECQMAVGATAGSAGGSAADATPPATGSAAGSAVPATGSNAVAQTDTKPADPAVGKPPETKPADTTTKPEDTKPADTKKPNGSHVTETKTPIKTPRADTHIVKTPVEPKPADTKPADTKPASADDPTKGYVQLGSKPSAKIFVDGSDTGKSTPIKLPVSPGKHKISFVVGDDRYTYPITVKAGETVPMQKDLQ